VLQLRIVLDGVEPVVRRRVVVPGSVRLDKLHRMIQAAMGWDDSHLHSFRIGDQLFGMQFDDYPDDELAEKSVTVLQAFRDSRVAAYEYDFGDSWLHFVHVEDLSRLSVGLRLGVCLAGKNACPPEDCGGAPGYAHLRSVLDDPDHEEREQVLKWLGGGFDPEEFDVALANARLQAVR
jgi:hypothetical protein